MITAGLSREKRLCVSERRWRDHSNRMRCGAVHLCVCLQERGRGSLGVAGLTHTCMRAVPITAALDSAFNGSWPCKTASKGNLGWYAASSQCHLCVCYCGICTSSITDTRGLSVLRTKSPYKPHLVSEQSGAPARQNISPC